ncbi:MAG: flagellar biosynthetic protein FliO [Oceanobacter sp.]
MSIGFIQRFVFILMGVLASALCLANEGDLLSSSSDVMASSAQAVANQVQPGSGLADPVSSLGKVALFLVLILALILGLAWLFQKSRILSGVHSAGAPAKLIETLAVQPLGVKEKIALVRVADKYLVIGVTSQQVRTLAELDQAPDLPVQAEASNFAELLKKAVKA